MPVVSLCPFPFRAMVSDFLQPAGSRFDFLLQHFKSTFTVEIVVVLVNQPVCFLSAAPFPHQ